MSIKSTWQDCWRLVRPYWVSEQRWRGRGLLALIVGLSLAQVYISVLINKWNAAFYDALQEKNLDAFFHQIGVFALLATFYIIAAVYRQYLMQMLHIGWRRWMTARLQGRWLAGHAFYRLQVLEKNTDNPDQRIADDVDGFTGSTLSLGIDLLSSVVTLVSFTAILWNLSGALEFTVLGTAVSIPGYMLWVAIVYAVIGNWLAHKIGRRLVGLNFEQQRLEANYRVALVRVRDNAESIAFYGGEGAEGAALGRRFAAIVSNWWQIMKKQKQLTWFTAAYSQVAIIFPILVAAPRYFSGAIQLGGLMQTASAFGQVQESLSWLVGVYPSFANWRATMQRLEGFEAAIDAPHLPTGFVRMIGDTAALANIDLQRPDGSTLASGLSLSLQPGERILLTGPSGSGKTTLLRAMAGLWPYGRGAITLPPPAQVLFVPQKSYLPAGTLAAALAYPDTAPDFDQEHLSAALNAVGLPALAGQLDHSDSWMQRLSQGEQQRLAFARILLQRPSLLLLDEATSALDEAAQEQMYQLLQQALPGTAVISVGHRPSLAALHQRQVAL